MVWRCAAHPVCKRPTQSFLNAASRWFIRHRTSTGIAKLGQSDGLDFWESLALSRNKVWMEEFVMKLGRGNLSLNSLVTMSLPFHLHCNSEEDDFAFAVLKDNLLPVCHRMRERERDSNCCMWWTSSTVAKKKERKTSHFFLLPNPLLSHRIFFKAIAPKRRKNSTGNLEWLLM